ncbi:hypothetical protein VM1G_00832 [Cytospora mali]|uniref:Uncharacterized protein n=1 Tax=Cytospora mali TaxID=578113 RepID=A0A194VNF0_CYTMA|nr:hypothetical protein VM1G_00832 [Valsa mali]
MFWFEHLRRRSQNKAEKKATKKTGRYVAPQTQQQFQNQGIAYAQAMGKRDVNDARTSRRAQNYAAKIEARTTRHSTAGLGIVSQHIDRTGTQNAQRIRSNDSRPGTSHDQPQSLWERRFGGQAPGSDGSGPSAPRAVQNNDMGEIMQRHGVTKEAYRKWYSDLDPY